MDLHIVKCLGFKKIIHWHIRLNVITGNTDMVKVVWK